MVHTEWHDEVLLATLDRPGRRNALDLTTLDELLDVVANARRRPARVVVITGAGGVFCAGADLTGVEDAGFAQTLRAVVDGFGALACPVMAAVDGPALG